MAKERLGQLSALNGLYERSDDLLQHESCQERQLTRSMAVNDQKSAALDRIWDLGVLSARSGHPAVHQMPAVQSSAGQYDF